MKLTAKIIALDADGTLFEDNYHGGLFEADSHDLRPKWDIINKVKQRITEGWDIILWTCRDGERLREAEEFCAQYGIPLVAVNDHHPQVKKICVECGYTPGPKIFAHEYWDDKAVTLKMICGG